MKLVLGGQLENALLREVEFISRPDRRRQSGHTYYDSLFRATDQRVFERCATFVALGKTTGFALVDWAFPKESVLAPADLGVSMVDCDIGEWAEEHQKLAGQALRRGALSKASEVWIEGSRYGDGSLIMPEARKFEYEGYSLDRFAFHYLCRLIAQIRSAQSTSAALVLCEPDREIISELSRFILEERVSLPFDFPSMIGEELVRAEAFAGGLIRLDAPDLLSVKAVREDKLVRLYAERVREAFSFSGLDQQRYLVRAMREAYDERQRIKGAKYVFEIISYLAKPLAFVGATLVTGGMKAYLSREHDRRAWHLISARMSQVSIEDYLHRTSNV